MREALKRSIETYETLSSIFPNRQYIKNVLTVLRTIDPDSPNINKQLKSRLIDTELQIQGLILYQDNSLLFAKSLECLELKSALQTIINS